MKKSFFLPTLNLKDLDSSHIPITTEKQKGPQVQGVCSTDRKGHYGEGSQFVIQSGMTGSSEGTSLHTFNRSHSEVLGQRVKTVLRLISAVSLI